VKRLMLQFCGRISVCSYRSTSPPGPHQQPAYSVSASRDAAAYKLPRNTDADSDNYCDCESTLPMTFV